MHKMNSFLILILLNTLDPGISKCFKRYPLEPKLKAYLALNESCADTLFPKPPCCGISTRSFKINSNARIINGAYTGLREYTWTVKLHIYSTYLFTDELEGMSCGGSLINPLWVISSGHCFKRQYYLTKEAVAYIGEWNIQTDPDCVDNDCADKVIVKNVLLEHTVVHPEYNPSILWTNDLALVRLEDPVIYSQFVNPICLPFYPLNELCYENHQAVATGWGSILSNVDFQTPSDIKLKTTLTVWKRRKCEKFKASTLLEDKYHICASGHTNFTCHGDSGGPLSLKLKYTKFYYLLGSVAGGNPTCDGTIHPAIFARINLKWVVDVILGAEHN